MSSRELETMLAALREETRGAEAPPRVEAALRDAFRAQAKRPMDRWWIGLAAGLAAALVLGAGVAQWKLSQPVAPPIARLQAPAPPALELPKPRPVMARRARPAAPRVPKAAPEPRELATDFLPLDDIGILTPMESAQVLRVQVPRSTMMRFGLPVNQDQMMEPIHADVVFAQDGIARAIRFVK